MFQTGTYVSQVFCKALNVRPSLRLRATNFIKNAAAVKLVCNKQQRQLIALIVMSDSGQRIELGFVSCVDLNKKQRHV